VTVLEQGSQPGHRWRNRYHSLRLNTVRGLSGLPGLPIPRTSGVWPRAIEFADYLSRYAEHHRLRVRTDHTAVRVERGHPRTGSRWSVIVNGGAGPLPADVVVVATGWAARPFIPDWPGAASYTRRFLHADAYRRPDPFAGRRVLVVGSGNSGVEIAVELLDIAAEVTISVRTPPLLIPGGSRGAVLQYVGAMVWWLPESMKDSASLRTHRGHYADLADHGLEPPREGAFSRFRAEHVAPTAERGLAAALRSGRLRVVAAVTGFGDDRVLLADGGVMTPDVVIAATGYRPTFADLVGHLGVLDSHGRPLAWAAPLPGAYGLFITGAPSLRGDLRAHGVAARQIRRLVRDQRCWPAAGDVSVVTPGGEG
jgi:cation diffusion facilitator CzcD-associated flavoprotein CzcO